LYSFSINPRKLLNLQVLWELAHVGTHLAIYLQLLDKTRPPTLTSSSLASFFMGSSCIEPTVPIAALSRTILKRALPNLAFANCTRRLNTKLKGVCWQELTPHRHRIFIARP